MLNSSQGNLKVGSAEKRHFKTSFRRQTSFSKQTLNSDNKKSHLGQKNSTKTFFCRSHLKIKQPFFCRRSSHFLFLLPKTRTGGLELQAAELTTELFLASERNNPWPASASASAAASVMEEEVKIVLPENRALAFLHSLKYCTVKKFKA